MKALQTFSDEYLAYCRKLSTEQIVRFVEDFRQLHGGSQIQKSELISLRVPLHLLRAFKIQAKARGIPYQTLIKSIMTEWLSKQ